MRKSEFVVVQPDPADPENRDVGKRFLITEMPAAQAEKWALRALLMLKGSGERIPHNVHGLGMVGVAILGFNIFLTGQIKAEDLMPLMDEMMSCVQIVRDPKHPDVASPLISDDDIQEVKTRLWLRSEVLRIHTNFSPAEALSKLIVDIQTSMESILPTT